MQSDSIRVNIKPLSVNEAFKGRRFKTDAYKKYEIAVMLLLPKFKLPSPPFRLTYEFGFSNICADIDNPVKNMTDILQKKYGFNDRDILELRVKKLKTAKGSEYINFSIEHSDILFL